MKITFLGTGTSTGIPMLTKKDPVSLSENPKDKRLRASVMISWDNVNYIIDCSPDFRQQMLREDVMSINGVFFTHEHSDHTAGFDDVRPYSYLMGAVPIYAKERVLESLKKRYDYIFATENRYKSAAKVEIMDLPQETFELDGVEVTAVDVMHGDLPITAYRFGGIAYLTDVKSVPEPEKEKLKGLDVLVVTALRKEPHYSHFNLEEALAFIEEVKPKYAYLTHISAMLGFHDEVEKELPENVFLAYDGLSVEV